MDTNFDYPIYTAPIPDFENYFVSTDGNVTNVNTGRVMSPGRLANGELMVLLRRDGESYGRSVKRLVAEAFVSGQSEEFDTPIILDGNKNHLRAENIMWRPRWFAWKYTRQFSLVPPYSFVRPVREIFTGAEYESVYDAGMKNGLLFDDVFMSANNETRVWPTGQRFEYI